MIEERVDTAHLQDTEGGAVVAAAVLHTDHQRRRVEVEVVLRGGSTAEVEVDPGVVHLEVVAVSLIITAVIRKAAADGERKEVILLVVEEALTVHEALVVEAQHVALVALPKG